MKYSVGVFDYENKKLGPLSAIAKVHKGDPYTDIIVCIVPRFNDKEFLSKLRFSSGHKYLNCDNGILAKGMFIIGNKIPAYLSSVATNPNGYQRMGLGKDFMEFCAMLIDETTCPEIEAALLTSGDFDSRLCFFQGLGFKTPEKVRMGDNLLTAFAKVEKLKSSNPFKFKLNKELSDKDFTSQSR